MIGFNELPDELFKPSTNITVCTQLESIEELIILIEMLIPYILNARVN